MFDFCRDLGRICGLAVLDCCRYADCNRSGRNVSDHHGIRADDGALANDHGSEDFGAGAYVHAIAQYRHFVWFFSRFVADCHALPKTNVVTDPHFGMDDNRSEMLDDASRTNLCIRSYVDSEEDLGKFYKEEMYDLQRYAYRRKFDRADSGSIPVESERPETLRDQGPFMTSKILSNLSKHDALSSEITPVSRL
ncbi:hypothetical protein FHT78_002015 [Rhizobium sp. BK196]|nr:hypothetical protein [Rhizobium sp. BK196]